MTKDVNNEISGLREQIYCPSCKTVYRIPRTEKTLRITCQKCDTVFYNRLTTNKIKSNRRNLIAILVALGVIGVILFNIFKERPIKENWVTINYGALVEQSTITHSGETIGEVVRKIPDFSDETKGLAQQYLEPYSILCHDVLLYNIGPDTIPLINIIAHYPVGSEQPAWASLFREGHFQLYYNENLIRLFLKGYNPEAMMKKYSPVVRYVIQNVLERHKETLNNIEVYVFNNDYSKMQLELNTIPAVYPIDELDISPTRRRVDLGSIEELLAHGIILEAIEVDKNSDLYLYGRKAKNQTIAGSPLSLADIAIVYRSIFHHGNNAPYISLDKNEDNRFAKVNFGGHLENTHVGHVVLEADKLFKTLSTGIDPNIHSTSRSIIPTRISGFLTEDERSLLEDQAVGRSLIRYWFYPDSIGTVTDGSIGIVESHQFMADVERMDVKVNVSDAIKHTIGHLNDHFPEYARADKTYKELNTVGRIMALINWLKGMNFEENVELDEFLSVIIPAFVTPSATKKMLAVSSICYSIESPPNESNIHENTHVVYLSHLLDKYRPTTPDEDFMKIAAQTCSLSVDFAPQRYKELKTLAREYEKKIKANEHEVESLKKQIEHRRHTVDQSSAYQIDSYNALINRYNSSATKQESYIQLYNSVVEKLKGMAIKTGQMTSIGGGIGMNPKRFKRVSMDPASSRIRQLISVKSTMKSAGKLSFSGAWIRNNIGQTVSRKNTLPVFTWNSSKKSNGNIKYSYHSDGGDFSNVLLSMEKNNWQTTVSVNGNEYEIKCKESTSAMHVRHSLLGNSFNGQISKDGKLFEFSRQ